MWKEASIVGLLVIPFPNIAMRLCEQKQGIKKDVSQESDYCQCGTADISEARSEKHRKGSSDGGFFNPH